MRSLLNPWIARHGHQQILLLRHGAVPADSEGKRFIGQTDLPLSDAGRHQARIWGDHLTGLPLAGIISSDLSRCMETSRIIAGSRAIGITPMTELREIDLGQWEGMTFDRVKKKWPQAFRARGIDLERFRPPGGESFLDLQKRVVPIFEKILDHSGGHMLIVAHAGVNRMILCHLLGMPTENLFHLEQAFGALNIIDRRAGRCRVSALNLLAD